MLFLPVSRWLELKGLPKGLAIFICVLLFVIIVVSIVMVDYLAGYRPHQRCRQY